MTVLMVTPYLPPSFSGVGDYTLAVAKGLRDTYATVATLAVFHSDSRLSDDLDEFPIIRLREDGKSFKEVFSSFNCIILNYVGYGYQKRGCPLHLKTNLERWRQIDSQHFLLTMFHELYAFGKPWQSSFWTHPLQKSICRKIASISDRAITNRKASAIILKEINGGKPVANLPVFSNVGEPLMRQPLREREPILVIFGGKDWRNRALQEDNAEISAACRKWRIEEVIEIGYGNTAEVNLGVPVKKLGDLAQKEVSSWLLRSRLGFVSYPSSFLEKSGIYAAYSAHGVVPVLPARSLVRDTLGVIKGRHYISPSMGDHSLAWLEDRSRDVFDWYQGHRLEVHVKRFAELLGILD